MDIEEFNRKAKEIFENEVIPQIKKAKMKQTAVEWFVEQITDNKFVKASDQIEVINKAKQMEKEQMKQIMWDLTDIDMAKTNKGLIIDNMFEQYYNETFKSE